jgi:cytochrome c551/c552
MKKVLFLTTFTLITSLVFAYNTDEGKTIFSTRCTACHAIDKNVVGPALMNVDQRHEEKWIIAFIHSSQTLVKSGDTAAVNLFQKFNSTVMPDHPDLTDEQIKSIISYIKDESKTITAKPKSTIQRPVELQASYRPIKLTHYTFWLTLFSSIGLLVWALLMRVKIEGLK